MFDLKWSLFVFELLEAAAIVDEAEIQRQLDIIRAAQSELDKSG